MRDTRARKLAAEAIANFKLDLSGLTVLTEAASNNYMLTPLIAAKAKAKRVYVVSKDTKYGKAVEVFEHIVHEAARWGVKDSISLIARDAAHVKEADIVTNLGFVRPIDKQFISRMKETAVVPLMWETWEFRPEDLDLEECRRRGIPVLGTNEGHPLLRTFDYVGMLAVKLLLEAGVEVFRSHVLIIGAGRFGDAAAKALLSAGAEVRNAKDNEDLSWPDALLVVEHESRDQVVGDRASVDIAKLKAVNPTCSLVHIAGNVDVPALKAAGIEFYPADIAPAGFMSRTTDYLGPRPLIDLHAAGLKIGELMARARMKGLKGRDCELSVLRETDIAQDFPVAAAQGGQA